MSISWETTTAKIRLGTTGTLIWRPRRATSNIRARMAYLEATQGTIEYMRTDAATGEIFFSDNIMDYEYGFMAGVTPDQVERIQHTLQYAYLIPGEAGKEAPAVRSAGQPRRFGDKPVQ